jgi:cytochrome c peroxidase
METDPVRAIASYERTQFSSILHVDHFIAADKNAISESAKRGWQLFNTKARYNAGPLERRLLSESPATRLVEI